MQTAFWQSEPIEQPFPDAQRLHPVDPPQSASVSLPFLTASEQLAATQTLAVQTWLSQSLPPVHFLPVTQGEHADPPQSTSDSSWFKTLSLQLGP